VAYCYRMLARCHEAEGPGAGDDAAAWKARDRYDRTRASVRTWLYRIAANVCLTALEAARGGRCRPAWSRRAAIRGAADAGVFDIPWLPSRFPDARY